MVFFRESMVVKEEDMMKLLMVQDSNSPYLAEVLTSIYDDTSKLLDAAEIAAEVNKSPKSVDNAVQRIRRKLAQQSSSGDVSVS